MEPSPKPEATKDIQEILRQRREMLSRVRQDLDKVKKLQQDLQHDLQQGTEKSAPPSKAPSAADRSKR